MCARIFDETLGALHAVGVSESMTDDTRRRERRGEARPIDVAPRDRVSSHTSSAAARSVPHPHLITVQSRSECTSAIAHTRTSARVCESEREEKKREEKAKKQKSNLQQTEHTNA